MREPLLLQLRQPPVLSVPGLWRRRGVYAMAFGVVRPVVLVDRLAERRGGFEALMFHEALHVQERHALAGVVVLVLGLVGLSVCLVSEQALGVLAFALLTPLAWTLWRRECEVRADAYAMRGVSTRGEVENGKPTVTLSQESWDAGAREFIAFTLLHPHPTGRFWRWCYGRDPVHRFRRAHARMRRERWVVG